MQSYYVYVIKKTVLFNKVKVFLWRKQSLLDDFKDITNIYDINTFSLPAYRKSQEQTAIARNRGCENCFCLNIVREIQKIAKRLEIEIQNKNNRAVEA